MTLPFDPMYTRQREVALCYRPGWGTPRLEPVDPTWHEPGAVPVVLQAGPASNSTRSPWESGAFSIVPPAGSLPRDLRLSGGAVEPMITLISRETELV
jgi:hypothetical protein